MQKNVPDACDAPFDTHDAAEHVVDGRPSRFATEGKCKGLAVLFLANIIEYFSDKCGVFQFFDYVNTLLIMFENRSFPISSVKLFRQWVAHPYSHFTKCFS